MTILWSRFGILLVLAGVGLASTATAKFAASNGEFSGREGDTCVLCHARASTTPSAIVYLDGLPARWGADVTYSLTIRIEGGPTPMPRPRPQGGFELEASGGQFAPGPGMGEFLRFPQPNVITYTAEGTRMRAWNVYWTAPALTSRPAPVTFWLAAVAANGNHIASGDDGAAGDAAAALTRTVRANQETLDRWRELPLAPPVVETSQREGNGWILTGRHTDENATHLGYRLAGGKWKSTETTRFWTLKTTHDPATLYLRSEGMGRISAGVETRVPEPTSMPLSLALLAVSLVAIIRRFAQEEHR